MVFHFEIVLFSDNENMKWMCWLSCQNGIEVVYINIKYYLFVKVKEKRNIIKHNNRLKNK